MKVTYRSILAILLLFSLCLSSCAQLNPITATADPEGSPSEESSESSDTVTEEKLPSTGPDVNGDGVIKILMVGNSFCYYYVEELYGIAKAAGIPMVVANVYRSGCTVQQHWSYLTSSSSPYDFYVTKESRVKKGADVSLRKCLTYDNWDIISLQGGSKATRAGNYEEGKEATLPYTKKLYQYFRNTCPNAIYYWNQTWSYQVGWEGVPGKDPAETPENQKVLTKEKQNTVHELIVRLSEEVAADCNVNIIPSSPAWQYARADDRVGDVLCARLGKGENHEGDFYHDGDIGGGQYLNACVWFEILTGQSCIGNSYRPKYTYQGKSYQLDESKIQALQEAAHRAVTEFRAAHAS